METSNALNEIGYKGWIMTENNYFQPPGRIDLSKKLQNENRS